MSHNKKNSKHKSKFGSSSSSTTYTKPLHNEDNEGFNKRKIEDNSRKYAISSDSEEEPPDFEYLLKLPSSTDSHFLLKSEQQKFNQESETSSSFSKHFHLDTKTLNLAMRSIPFNERYDIKGISFNSGELQIMADEASFNENLYREHLEKVIFESEEKRKVPNLKTLEEKVENIKIVEAPINPRTSTVKENDKESMQQWLDNVLDI